MAERNARPLGHVQRYVLLSMGDGRPHAVDTRGGAFYPFREEQVRSAINSLGRRGLVDVAGFDGRKRTYAITSTGAEAIRRITADHCVACGEELDTDRGTCSNVECDEWEFADQFDQAVKDA